MPILLTDFFTKYPVIRQKNLAELAGVNKTTLNLAVNGDRINREQVQQLQDALHDLGKELLAVELTHDNYRPARAKRREKKTTY